LLILFTPCYCPFGNRFDDTLRLLLGKPKPASRESLQIVVVPSGPHEANFRMMDDSQEVPISCPYGQITQTRQVR
jgi:hypothetical protein